MPVCKNCGGSNKKVILNYTPKAYTICPDPGQCPESYKCSEILDSACVQYTSDKILLCDTSYIVINKFESLESALASILEILCQTPPRCTLAVNIIPNQNENTFPTLSTVITNGQAPYTYKWKIAQGDFVGHLISGTSTSSTLNLTCIASNVIRTGSINKNIKISNIELTVTDAKGCRQIVHFVYTSDCYPMIVDSQEPRQAFLGGRLFNNNGYETPFALPVISFMDDAAYMPTCTELKNICCVEGYEDYDEAAEEYRALRDQYYISVNENILNQSVGSPNPDDPLDYSPWEPGGLGDDLIIFKGGLMNYNMLYGCPECTYKIWNEVSWPQLNNKTLAQIFSMLDPEECTKFVWIQAVPFGSTPPAGQPGQMVKWATDPLDPDFYNDYAWNPVSNTWSETLANVLSDILNTDSSRKVSWLSALNQVILSSLQFIYANEYVLLHRYKYELKYPL